jgi:hypothetical protein
VARLLGASRPEGLPATPRRTIGAVLRRALPGLPVVALVAVLAVGGVAVSGCAAGGTSGGSGPSASPTATQTITVHFTGGVISPPPGRVVVPVGTAVHLVVTSDVAEEVHNHYDNVEQEVTPGGTVTFDFVAEHPGIYEVELHHANKQLLELQVQ